MVKQIQAREIDAYVERVEDWSRLPASPVVSVAIITYNHKDYIRQCLDNVLNQETTFAYEIIIKEDKSTDGTREIVADYQRRYPHLFRIWFCRENLWKKVDIGSHVRAACRGQYIALLEGDDYWTDPLKLQKQVDLLEAQPGVSLCFHPVEHVVCGGVLADFNIQARLPLEYRNATGPALVGGLLQGRIFVNTCSMVIRSSVVNPFPSWLLGVFAGDLAMMVLCATRGSFAMIEDKMGAYRMHTGGVHASKGMPQRVAASLRDLNVYRSGLAAEYQGAVKDAEIEANRLLHSWLTKLCLEEMGVALPGTAWSRFCATYQGVAAASALRRAFAGACVRQLTEILYSDDSGSVLRVAWTMIRAKPAVLLNPSFSEILIRKVLSGRTGIARWLWGK